MDITPYVEALRRDLLEAAATGDHGIDEAASRLTTALAPATRLALMEAISQAAAEITSRMPDGSVDVRLAGRELEFVVEHPNPVPDPPAAPAPPPPPGEPEDEGGTARVSLRLPESVKARAEELADTAGQSLNTWLVNTIRNATNDAAIRVDVDLGSIPFAVPDPFGRGRGRSGRRMTGWI